MGRQGRECPRSRRSSGTLGRTSRSGWHGGCLVKGDAAVRRTAAVAAVGALLLLAGCNDNGTTPHSAATTTSAAPAAPAQLSVSPASGATDVSPVVPLQLSVTGGEVTQVALVDGG